MSHSEKLSTPTQTALEMVRRPPAPPLALPSHRNGSPRRSAPAGANASALSSPSDPRPDRPHGQLLRLPVHPISRNGSHTHRGGHHPAAPPLLPLHPRAEPPRRKNDPTPTKLAIAGLVVWQLIKWCVLPEVAPAWP
jgi:hypothetical protein